mgnify:CR=1 FL=1
MPEEQALTLLLQLKRSSHRKSDSSRDLEVLNKVVRAIATNGVDNSSNQLLAGDFQFGIILEWIYTYLCKSAKSADHILTAEELHILTSAIERVAQLSVGKNIVFPTSVNHAILTLLRRTLRHAVDPSVPNASVGNCLAFMSTVFSGFCSAGNFLSETHTTASELKARQQQRQADQIDSSSKSHSRPSVALFAKFTAEILGDVHRATLAVIAPTSLIGHVQQHSGAQRASAHIQTQVTITDSPRLLRCVQAAEHVLRVFLGIVAQNKGNLKSIFSTTVDVLLEPLLTMTGPFCFLTRLQHVEPEVVAATARVRILIEAVVSEILFAPDCCQSMHSVCQLFLNELYSKTQFKQISSKTTAGLASLATQHTTNMVSSLKAILTSKNAAKNFGLQLFTQVHTICQSSDAALAVLSPLLLNQFFRNCRKRRTLGYGGRSSQHSQATNKKSERQWWAVVPYQFSIFLFFQAIANSAASQPVEEDSRTREESSSSPLGSLDRVVSCSLCRQHCLSRMLIEMNTHGIYQPHVDVRKRFYHLLKIELGSHIAKIQDLHANIVDASTITQLVTADSSMRVVRAIFELEHLLLVNEEDDDDDAATAVQHTPSQESAAGVNRDLMIVPLEKVFKLILAAGAGLSTNLPTRHKKSKRKRSSLPHKQQVRTSLLWDTGRALLKQSVQQYAFASLRTYTMLRRITYWFSLHLTLENQISCDEYPGTGKLLAELLVWNQDGSVVDGFVTDQLAAALRSVPTAQIEDVFRFLTQQPPASGPSEQDGSSESTGGAGSLPTVKFQLPNNSQVYDFAKVEHELASILHSKPHGAKAALPETQARQLAVTLMQKLETGQLQLSALQAKLRQDYGGRILQIDSCVVEQNPIVLVPGQNKTMKNLQALLGKASNSRPAALNMADSSTVEDNTALSTSSEPKVTTLRRYFVEAFLTHCQLTVQNAQTLVNIAGGLAHYIDVQIRQKLPFEKAGDKATWDIFAVPWDLWGLWYSLQKFSDRCCHFANVQYQASRGTVNNIGQKLRFKLDQVLRQTTKILSQDGSPKSNASATSSNTQRELVITLLRVAACQLSLCARTSSDGVEAGAIADEMIELVFRSRVGWLVLAENADVVFASASLSGLQRVLRWLFTPSSVRQLRDDVEEHSLARRCFLGSAAFYEIAHIHSPAETVLRQTLRELVTSFSSMSNSGHGEPSSTASIVSKLKALFEIVANFPPRFFRANEDDDEDDEDGNDDQSWLGILLRFDTIIADTIFVVSHFRQQQAKRAKLEGNGKALSQAQDNGCQLHSLYSLLVSCRRAMNACARDQPSVFLGKIFADSDADGRIDALHRFCTQSEHGIFTKYSNDNADHFELSWQLALNAISNSFYSGAVSLFQREKKVTSVGTVEKVEISIGSRLKELVQHVICVADDHSTVILDKVGDNYKRATESRRLWRGVEIVSEAMDALARAVDDTRRDRAWGRKTDSVGTGGVNTRFQDEEADNDEVSDEEEETAAIVESFALNRSACTSVMQALSGLDKTAVQIASVLQKRADDSPHREFGRYLKFCGALIGLHASMQRLHNERAKWIDTGGSEGRRKNFSMRSLDLMNSLPYLLGATTSFVRDVVRSPTRSQPVPSVHQELADKLAHSCVSQFVTSVCSVYMTWRAGQAALENGSADFVRSIPFSNMILLAWAALALENQTLTSAASSKTDRAFSDVDADMKKFRIRTRTFAAVSGLIAQANSEDLDETLRIVRMHCDYFVLSQSGSDSRRHDSPSQSTNTGAYAAATMQLLRSLCSCRGDWWKANHDAVVHTVFEVATQVTDHHGRCGDVSAHRDAIIWQIHIVEDMLAALLSRERSVVLSSADVAMCLRLTLQALESEVSASEVPSSLARRRAVLDGTCLLAMTALKHRPRCVMRVATTFVDVLRFLMRVALGMNSRERAAFTSVSFHSGGFVAQERRYFAETWTRIISAASDLKHAMRRFYSFLVAEYVDLFIKYEARAGSQQEGSVEVALREGAFGLLDALTKNELQSLYVSLSTPSAVALKALYQKYEREHKFSGKV